MKRLKKTDKAYLAGLIDGEGCVRIAKKRVGDHFNYQAWIIVTNSNLPALCWIKEVTDCGSIYKYKKAHKANWKLVHRWQVAARQAREVLKAVLPYLKIKKEIAQVVLSMPLDKTSSLHIPEQERLFNRIKDMNKRGVIIPI